MKKLKLNKIIALVAILVVMVMLLTVKSEAATVTTGLDATSSIQVGDTVSVYVTTTGTTNGIIGLQGKLTYDTTKLEFVSFGPAKTGWEAPSTSYNAATGLFISEISDVTDTANYVKATTATRVAVFKLKVKAGATGTANVTLVNSKATEATTATSFTTATGSSNVVKALSIFVPSSNITIDNTNKVITAPVTSTTTPTTGNTVKPNLPTGTTVGTGGPGTGAIIKVPDPNDPSKTIDYTLLVKYDVTGDGLMNSADLMAIRSHIVQKTLLTGNFLKMADVNADSTVDVTDVMMMKLLISKL